MKKHLVTFALAASVAFAQDYKMEPSNAAPADLAPAFASAISPSGYKVLAPNGSIFCEVWFRKTLPAGPKSTEDAVAFPTIPQGALIGVIRFPARGADRRGQQIKPGTYTLRYSWFPINGDHQGVAPQRDFLLMVPSGEDKDPASTPDAEALVTMSRKASGTPHPAVLSLEAPGAASKVPGLNKEGEHDWSLAVKIGDQAIALIVVGKAEG